MPKSKKSKKNTTIKTDQNKNIPRLEETDPDTFIVSDKFFIETNAGRLLVKGKFIHKLLIFWDRRNCSSIWIEGPGRNISDAREAVEIIARIFKCKLSSNTERIIRPTADNKGERTDWRFKVEKHPILRGVS